jgi:arsenate reductase
MAEAWFGRLADPAKARALSAGTRPGQRVHPEVVAAMREVGIDLSEVVPRKLSVELAAGVDVLVTMGCGDDCPVVPGIERDDWPLDDPKGQPIERVRQIRDDVEQRVRRMLADRGWSRAAR